MRSLLLPWPLDVQLCSVAVLPGCATAGCAAVHLAAGLRLERMRLGIRAHLHRDRHHRITLGACLQPLPIII